MGIQYHPKRGTIVVVDFNQGFREPEMVKTRLCIVMSPPIQARPGLSTVVPLSTSPPDPVQAHHLLEIPFEIPEPWGNRQRWVKADMICAVGWHRVNLLRMGKTDDGKRIYQFGRLTHDQLRPIVRGIMHSIGGTVDRK